MIQPTMVSEASHKAEDSEGYKNKIRKDRLSVFSHLPKQEKPSVNDILSTEQVRRMDESHFRSAKARKLISEKTN